MEPGAEYRIHDETRTVPIRPDRVHMFANARTRMESRETRDPSVRADTPYALPNAAISMWLKLDIPLSDDPQPYMPPKAAPVQRPA